MLPGRTPNREALAPAPWMTQHLLPQPAVVSTDGDAGGPVAPFELKERAEPLLLEAVTRLNARLLCLQPELNRAAPVALPLRIALPAPVPEQAVPQLGDDARYRLTLSSNGAEIEAVTVWGALAALETLAQYLAQQPLVRNLQVEDVPRFPWRGVLLDPARRFLPIPVLRQTVAALAALKINVLHLHLTDDQGFRFPSRRWPRLTSAQHYSRAELGELIAFAASHGVRIVPELDMPGHVTSWLLGYPQLGVSPIAESDRFGVHKAALDPLEPLVHAVVEDLLDEVVELFPDQCVHVGGDEVHAASWLEDDALMQRAAGLGITEAATLQARFTARVAEAVLARGRTPVLWDEALHPELERFGERLIIGCWRGATARDRALAAGHRAIVAAGYYLDLNYPAAWHYEYDPGADEAELIAHEDLLQTDPAFQSVAAGLRWTDHWRDAAASVPSQAGLLGGQACLWGELVDAAALEQRLFSRLPAIAERLWTPVGNCDVDNLTERLLLCHAYLDDAGLTQLRGDAERPAPRGRHWPALEVACGAAGARQMVRSSAWCCGPRGAADRNGDAAGPTLRCNLEA